MHSAASIALHVRRHAELYLYDASEKEACGICIYTLADPRELRELRYVGQTANPQQRFLQHMRTARLWLPQTVPWWVKSPKLRPLYEWIRELYLDDCRLPVMIIHAWEDTRLAARAVERNLIISSLENGLPILNVEAQAWRASAQRCIG